MKRFIKYGLVAIFGYLFLFIGTFLLVEVFNFAESFSYFIVITFDYIAVYFLNLKFVFGVSLSGGNAIKYIVYLFFSWIINNLFFILMTNILNVYYIISILINIAVFGLIKYFIQKKLIFNKH